MFCTRECGGALVQHPPAPGGDGGTPGSSREHLTTQVTNTKNFYHGKCFA